MVTYPSRHPWARPFPNMKLHTTVLGGIGMRLTSAWLLYSAGLFGNAGIPIELWGLVAGGAFLVWGLATAASGWQPEGLGGAAR